MSHLLAVVTNAALWVSAAFTFSSCPCYRARGPYNPGNRFYPGSQVYFESGYSTISQYNLYHSIIYNLYLASQEAEAVGLQLQVQLLATE